MEEWWGGDGESPLDHNARHAIQINVSGLYCLICGSKEKEAQVFAIWVCSEVLQYIGQIRANMMKSHAINQCGLIAPKEKGVAKSGLIVTSEAIDKYVLIVTQYDMDNH